MRRKSDGEPEFYTRLGLLRSERGMSRQQLAETIGVHYQTVGYIERGEYRPSVVLALRIAEVFGLPVETVFSLTPFQPLSEQLYGKESSR